MDRVLALATRTSTRHPWAVVGVSAGLLVAAALGMSQLRFAHYPLRWLPEDSHVRQATELVDRELRGSITLEVLLEREGENAWSEPDSLRELERLSREAERYSEGELFVGRAFSIVDVLKEIHRALDENQIEYYRVPEERRVIAQEFLLFENSGSDDLEDLVDSRFTTARLTLKVPFLDANSFWPSASSPA